LDCLDSIVHNPVIGIAGLLRGCVMLEAINVIIYILSGIAIAIIWNTFVNLRTEFDYKTKVLDKKIEKLLNKKLKEIENLKK
jgi:hypothetical protein